MSEGHIISGTDNFVENCTTTGGLPDDPRTAWYTPCTICGEKTTGYGLSVERMPPNNVKALIAQPCNHENPPGSIIWIGPGSGFVGWSAKGEPMYETA